MLKVTANAEAEVMTSRRAHGRLHGFTVLQLLIVFAIVAAVAGIGLPVYAARAKDVVLEQNAGSLGLQIRSILALGEGPGGDVSGVPAELVRALKDGDAGRYVNPVSGDDAVVWQTALPGGDGSAAPAVWITDDARYAHSAFAASAATRSRLAGTLLVVFVDRRGVTSSVDIFSVDGQGRCSQRTEELSLAAVTCATALP
jgi:type II secretory pathway pseudopilin PulG